MSAFRIGAPFRGDEALVTVEGPVDRDQRDQVVTLVGALVAAGARHVCVDVAPVRPADAELLRQLERERRHVRSIGGCMVVDGATTAPEDDDTATLMEAFVIYRHAVGTRAPSFT